MDLAYKLQNGPGEGFVGAERGVSDWVGDETDEELLEESEHRRGVELFHPEQAGHRDHPTVIGEANRCVGALMVVLLVWGAHSEGDSCSRRKREDSGRTRGRGRTSASATTDRADEAR
jgi:hypothetical protein